MDKKSRLKQKFTSFYIVIGDNLLQGLYNCYEKWLFYLLIDSLNSGVIVNGGSCIDTQINLETDQEWKFHLIKAQQCTKSRSRHIKKVNKIKIKDLLIITCFKHSH